MINSTSKPVSIQRLERLLQNQYNKGLEIKYLMDASEKSSDVFESRVSDGDLYVPITQSDLFLGVAKIPRIYDLEATTVQAITDVVKLVLEAALYRQYLERTELSALEISEQADPAPLSNSQSPMPVILLRAYNPHFINRAAISLHEATERWAMLRYKDIGSSLSSVPELKQLGRATVFIEDILEISPSDLQVIEEYMQSHISDQDPLIVIGTTQFISDIRSSKQLTIGLSKLLFSNLIELDRWPVNGSALREAFTMLFSNREEQSLS